MSTFDFPNAKPAELLPLVPSHEENTLEAEIKALALQLWNEGNAHDSFDVNVLGMAHLGTFNLVRKSVNMDGLVLMQGDREEASTRYLYRAWKSRDRNGRGLFFLKTYLQMLWPNACIVEQMWQEKTKPYPMELLTTQQVKEKGLRSDEVFLTSRIDIAIDFSAQPHNFRNLLSIVCAVIPARFLPVLSKVIASSRYKLSRRAFYRDIESVFIYPQIKTKITFYPAVKMHPVAVAEVDKVEIKPL